MAHDRRVSRDALRLTVYTWNSTVSVQLRTLCLLVHFWDGIRLLGFGADVLGQAEKFGLYDAIPDHCPRIWNINRESRRHTLHNRYIRQRTCSGYGVYRIYSRALSLSQPLNGREPHRNIHVPLYRHGRNMGCWNGRYRQSYTPLYFVRGMSDSRTHEIRRSIRCFHQR